jgi:hypothetical protein
MLGTARTFNPAFCCWESKAYGWPFPWETIDSHHSGPGLRHPADYWAYNFTILLGASFFVGRCARSKPVARPILSVIAMLTVAPLLAVAILLGCTPKGRGDLLYPIAVATYVWRGMAFNWVTYLLALIMLPVLMRCISARRSFHQLPLQRLLKLSVFAGAAGGVCVVIRSLLTALDGAGALLVLAVAFAGAASGAITLTLIGLLYRGVDSRAEPCASPNGGPAAPVGDSGVMEGPPSVS